ncbi:MAG: hypothetical protein BWK80_19265 [Desulfobacteraceae bacterium IS3]|nr:MAG: hypothetical protein BWK80_19265 [Desulfobacteraceae bacterium IS3]HAO21911.1 hypothetical protein [Desulfobacteraceae bacterium]
MERLLFVQNFPFPKFDDNTVFRKIPQSFGSNQSRAISCRSAFYFDISVGYDKVLSEYRKKSAERGALRFLNV